MSSSHWLSCELLKQHLTDKLLRVLDRIPTTLLHILSSTTHYHITRRREKKEKEEERKKKRRNKMEGVLTVERRCEECVQMNLECGPSTASPIPKWISVQRSRKLTYTTTNTIPGSILPPPPPLNYPDTQYAGDRGSARAVKPRNCTNAKGQTSGELSDPNAGSRFSQTNPAIHPPPQYPGSSQDPMILEKARSKGMRLEVREEDEVPEEEVVQEEEDEETGKEVEEIEEEEEEEVATSTRIIPETDAQRLINDVGEGGSNIQGRKREYEEELEKGNWECKKKKRNTEWVEAVFNDHQLIQEDQGKLLGLVTALKDSWEEAEEKIKQGKI
ncbi:hypothetical protein VP01_3074g1 [Puccinia sorghi]|uniref:Uncharacterized protein n=1 Tax=Puccinia sorghi TaxID=27349 RepID=A0A0L6V1J4_9BASI|nr:hypothetical protein VP01_3074g1 [Puccinia sorghi]